MKKIFKPADVMLPKKNADLTKWAVVACDQHTSNRVFWNETREIVDGKPSTLDLMLPEVYLEDFDVDERIKRIHLKMDEYVSSGVLGTLKDSIIFVERKQQDGRIRHGVVGMVDLEEYDYKPGSKSLIRATEGTIEERIPPRLRVREKARLELPHIMLLVDDPAREIIEGLCNKVSSAQMVYSFELMQCGGSIIGYSLDKEQKEHVINGIARIAEKSTLALAVGDGNHSLATAKAHWVNIKNTLSKDKLENHPARYALVEVVNLHSTALDFEPIHRVVMGIDKKHILAELKKSGCNKNDVGSLQNFIDTYIKQHGGIVDYIHGAAETMELGAKPDNVAFLLPAMNKHDLFPAIVKGGSLPRKTFSMGDSIHGKQEDKRFYLEVREIIQ